MTSGGWRRERIDEMKGTNSLIPHVCIITLCTRSLSITTSIIIFIATASAESLLPAIAIRRCRDIEVHCRSSGFLSECCLIPTLPYRYYNFARPSRRLPPANSPSSPISMVQRINVSCNEGILWVLFVSW